MSDITIQFELKSESSKYIIDRLRAMGVQNIDGETWDAVKAVLERHAAMWVSRFFDSDIEDVIEMTEIQKEWFKEHGHAQG